MEKAAPPSPAPSQHDDLSQLAQHNETANPRPMMPEEEALLATMGGGHKQEPQYSTPPIPHGLPTYYNPQMPYPPPQQQQQQPQYGFPPGYGSEGSAYPNPEEHAPSLQVGYAREFPGEMR